MFFSLVGREFHFRSGCCRYGTYQLGWAGGRGRERWEQLREWGEQLRVERRSMRQYHFKGRTDRGEEGKSICSRQTYRGIDEMKVGKGG